MKAREIMAQAQAEFWDAPETAEGYLIIVDRVLEALTAAGYRILGPRQIDREKVARAICEAGNHKWPETDGYNDKAEKRAFLIMADAAIRSLTHGSMEGED